MPKLWISLLLVLGTSGGNWLAAQPPSSSQDNRSSQDNQSSQDNHQKRPLDLPITAFGRDTEEVEDFSESVTFYGREYESQTFVWCLDRSGSMLGERLAVLKLEVTQALQSLTRQSQIGLVSFATSHDSWKQVPVQATVANKASAIAWVQQLDASGATCMAAAAVKAINICNLSRKRDKSVILLSDGQPNCPYCDESYLAIRAANWQQNPVNTLFVGNDAQGAACMQQIAAANRGSFAQVQ